MRKIRNLIRDFPVDSRWRVRDTRFVKVVKPHFAFPKQRDARARVASIFT